MDTLTELNMALARALGVPDTMKATKVTLVLSAGELPRVVVENILRDGDRLVNSSAEWRLARVASNSPTNGADAEFGLPISHKPSSRE